MSKATQDAELAKAVETAWKQLQAAIKAAEDAGLEVESYAVSRPRVRRVTVLNLDED